MGMAGQSDAHHSQVTCMDARIDPAAAFGIELGDAHVIRNAGASAKAAIRDIVISEQCVSVHTKLDFLEAHSDIGFWELRKSS